MQTDFWLERWQNGVIGFHLNAINPNLLQFWPGMKARLPAQVFIPLCGKSLDIHWLSQQGYGVLGVELSEAAVQAFFTEAGLQPSRSKHGLFESWQSGNIRILCGDFFDLTLEDIADSKLIYDRAALIALPEDMRARYVAHLQQLFIQPTQCLLVVMNYPQYEMQGPPFSIADEEIAELYRGADIHLLHETDILSQEPRFRNKGVSRLSERVYILTWTAEGDL
jgi:thiopurine S-methyltransferase